jgi:hypothetical protein
MFPFLRSLWSHFPSRQARSNRLTRQLQLERLETRECPALTLTPAGQALGLALSTFATGFPTTSGNGGTGNGIAGPGGIAFPGSGGVLVGDAPGNVRLFPTDLDGQTALAAPVGQSYGLDNALGVAMVGTHIYMAQLSSGRVVEINPDGTLNQVIVTGVPLAAGIVANPTNGHLFVSTISNNQIFEVDPIARTKTLFANASFDGLAISPDGSTLYGARVYNDPASQGHVWGYNTTTHALVFDSGFLGTVGIDGIALATGPLAGNIFVNTNDGTVVEVNVTTLAQTTVATNGTRGDFVTVDPTNNTLLLTQSDSLVRMSPGLFAPNKTNTTTVVTSSPSPSVYGQSVTFTATVRSVVSGAGTPQGTVTFYYDQQDAAHQIGAAKPLNSASATSDAITSLTAASHTIYAVYSGDTNFNTSTSTLTQTVTPAPLTVTADDKMRGYGQTNPAFTASYSGFVNGDTASSLGGNLSLTTAATTSSPAGTYPIVAGGLTSSNYTISFMNGTLTVSKAAAGIVVNPYTGTYDGQFHGVSGSATGVLDEDLSALLSLGSTARNAGHYDVAWSFAGNNNYDSASGTSTIDIAQRTLHVGATADSKVYDGSTVATAHLSDDRLAGDVFTDSYASATFSDPNVGTGKMVAVNGISISGPDAGNYILASTTATTTADITSAATSTTLTASAATPLFGDTVTFIATVSGAPGDFTGTVDFFDSTTQTDLGTVPLINGTAVRSIGTLALGGHTITATYSGDGNFLSSSASTSITVIPPASMSGVVFEDFNNDGQVDFGEQGIPGVTITLAGRDNLGQVVNLSQKTDGGGMYAFLNLRPGTYTLTEAQPAGYSQGINSVGTAGGSLVATDTFSVGLGQGVNGLNYNYGERPSAGGAAHSGQTATIGFWNNKNGQALIKALNGGPSSTQLGDWLAATLPNMYGANAGSNDLAGKSNAYIAALFQQDFLQTGQKLDSQVLATALSVYVTNATLDPTAVAAQYGFTVSGDGVGTATVNVGSNGSAFGVANNTALTVMDLLLATNAQTVSGVLYNGNSTLRNEAITVYTALNRVGDIN